MTTATPSLHGPLLTLRRAYAHLETFEDLAEPFIAEETARISMRYDEALSCQIFELTPSPTPPEWGPIIGDSLFNCRSSMDQLANHLAGGDRDDRDTGFPICKDAESFGKESTKQMMARMSPDAMAFVEDAQPFKEARTQHPEYDALWVLHDLCNIDKHRQLHLTALAFEGASHMGQMNIAGMNFGLLGSESPTVQLAAVKVSSPEEKPPLSFRLEIALTDVLRWQMPVGVSRFLKEVIGLVHDIFKESVARGLLVSTVLA